MTWMNASAVAAADRRNAEDHGKESPDGYGIRARDDFSTPHSVEETEARLAARRAEDEARAPAIITPRRRGGFNSPGPRTPGRKGRTMMAAKIKVVYKSAV